MTETPERARVLDLLRNHGWNATSFQTLESDFRYWFAPEGDACVAFVETPGAWVAAGAPIAPEARLAPVVEAFRTEARASHRRAAFFAAEARLLTHTPLRGMQIGEQPVWEPARWPERLAATRSLREQLRRARAKGVVVRPVEHGDVAPGAPLRTAFTALIARWLHARKMAPMGFLVAVQPFEFAAERRYFLAERGGVPVGFLAAVPIYARRGWLFEDLLRDPMAPNGTAELLVDAAMRSLAGEGAATVTLGLAPLAGAVAPSLRLARRVSKPLYDFAGLRAFKAKLRPDAWEPVYLAYAPGTSSHLALVDSLAAFAHGSFLRFGRDTLLGAARRRSLAP